VPGADGICGGLGREQRSDPGCFGNRFGGQVGLRPVRLAGGPVRRISLWLIGSRRISFFEGSRLEWLLRVHRNAQRQELAQTQCKYDEGNLAVHERLQHAGDNRASQTLQRSDISARRNTGKGNSYRRTHREIPVFPVFPGLTRLSRLIDHHGVGCRRTGYDLARNFSRWVFPGAVLWTLPCVVGGFCRPAVSRHSGPWR